MNQVMFSSKNEVWATPQDFFDKLNEEFHFTLDPCALPENAKCKKFFTPEQDGLRQNWGGQKSFVTRPMGVKLAIGYANVMKKVRNLTLLLSC